MELIKELEKNYKNIDINIIKKLFGDEFISDFIWKNNKEEIIISNFDIIFFLYKNVLNELGIINSDENEDNDKEKKENSKINFNELFLSIYNHFFNIDNSNNYLTQRKDNFTENENIDKKILYNNLMKILPFLTNFEKNRNLFDKINHLFNTHENIILALYSYSEKFIDSSEDKNPKKNNLFYNLMHYFLKKNFEVQKIIPKSNINTSSSSLPKKDISIINHEGYFLKLFNNILTNIYDTFKLSPKLFNNSVHLLLCDFFQKIIKKLYKYLMPTMRELDKLIQNNLFFENMHMNKIKIKSLDKIYDEIFYNYLTKVINNSKLGNHIRNESIKVIPYLILYGKNRVNYFKYIQEHILQSKSFFSRRYSIIYLDKCLQIFSFKMFNKIGLLDFLITLTEDENNSISAGIVNLIYIYRHKITKNSGIMFQNILKNLSKINEVNKDNKIIHIENFDIEKNRIIKDILNIDYNDEKNINNEYWINLENKLIKNEKEIFGDDSFYGFHHLKNVVRSQTLNLNSQSINIKTMKRKSSYLNNIINKDKEKINNSNNKKTLTRDKCASSVSINNFQKTILPKIKPNRNNVANSMNGKISLRPPIKKFNNFKLKQENQKFYETITKNNNSMVLSEKINIKSSYDFIQKNKLETKAIKVSHILPNFPDLFNNTKQDNLLIESYKNPNERKHKENSGLLHTMYKTKSLGYHLDISKSSKNIKLKKNNLKEKSASYSKINFKTNSDLDKLNLTNITSNKDKNGISKWYIK